MRTLKYINTYIYYINDISFYKTDYINSDVVRSIFLQNLKQYCPPPTLLYLGTDIFLPKIKHANFKYVTHGYVHEQKKYPFHTCT
jgi:hypothetical protein